MIRLLRFFFYSFDNSLLFLLFISLLSGFVSPEITWLAPFISFAFPVLFVLYFCFLVYAFFRKRKWKIKLLILIALAFFYFKNQISFSSNKSESTDFRVMGFNARLFDIYNWIDRKAWADWTPRTDNGRILNNIYSNIKEVDADVICLQEYYNQKKSAYATKDTLKKYGYKYKHIKFLSEGKSHGVFHQYGIATFSKYPIINTVDFDKDQGFSNGALITDIKIKLDTVRVINVHFNSYRLSKENYHTLKLIKNIEKDSLESVDFFNLIETAERGISSRWSEIKKIKSIANESPYPIIISCDLNEAPNTFGYKHLRKNLNDAFLESGFGTGSTMVSSYPLRIDYLFSSSNLKTYNFDKGEDEISDHYPIWTDYVIEK